MLTNAIAEMRTYGEGFIIADQAPGFLDMAVIRNTNTKIIMRLPDLSDRELVGRAANLNDDQITELARLPCGVAAVYQNEWVEAVLCKVHRYKIEKNLRYEYKTSDEDEQKSLENRIKIVKKLCQIAKNANNLDDLKKELNENIKNYNFGGSLFVSCMQYLDSARKKPDYNKLDLIVSGLLPEFSKMLKDSALKNPAKVKVWRNDLQETIEKSLRDVQMQNDIDLRNSILQCVLQNYILKEINRPDLLTELLKNKPL